MEILIFAAIAGFLVFKLYTTLGQRTGLERPLDISTAQTESASYHAEKTVDPLVEDILETTVDKAVREKLLLLKTHLPTFTVSDFLKKATLAFELILTAFAKEDIPTLSMMLGPDPYQEFTTTIEERRAQGDTLETTLVKVESVKLTDLEMQGTVARLTVDFQTEQIHITRDAQGNIIDGDPKQIEQLFDSWIFERDVAKSNPAWKLVKIAA